MPFFKNYFSHFDFLAFFMYFFPPLPESFGKKGGVLLRQEGLEDGPLEGEGEEVLHLGLVAVDRQPLLEQSQDCGAKNKIKIKKKIHFYS